MLDSDFTYVNEVYDSEAKEYIVTFECSQETYNELVDKYGTVDFEKQLSKDFEAYVKSLRESLDD